MLYSLCNQTVTIYHKDGNKFTQRTVNNAFFDFRKNENVDKTGSHEVNSFLLIIPGEQIVFPEDKVLLGTGPMISTREEWTKFIPAKVPRLVVVKTVDPKYYGGKLSHVEAGG